MPQNPMAAVILGQQQSQNAFDNSRKTAAYNALKEAYGPAVAYDPVAAFNASKASVAKQTEGNQVQASGEDLRKSELENNATQQEQQRMAAYRATQMLLSQSDPSTGAVSPDAYNKIIRPNAKLFGIPDDQVESLGALLNQPGGADYLRNFQQSMIGPTKVQGATAYGTDANGNPVAITRDQYGNVHQQSLGGTQTTQQQNATTGQTNAKTNQGKLGVAQQNANTSSYRAQVYGNNSEFGAGGGPGPGGGGAPAGPVAPGGAAPQNNALFDRLPPKGKQKAISQADQIVNAGSQLATTNKIIDTVIGQISPYTTGTGSLLSKMPGTAATDLKANLKTLQAQGLTAWISSLKNSSGQTGIGRILQSEANAAMTLFGNMEQDQNAKQLAFHATLFKQVVNKLYTHQQQAFRTMYGKAPHEALGTEDPMAPPAPAAPANPALGAAYKKYGITP
jgi:hypothetical protein